MTALEKRVEQGQVFQLAGDLSNSLESIPALHPGSRASDYLSKPSVETFISLQTILIHCFSASGIAVGGMTARRQLITMRNPTVAGHQGNHRGPRQARSSASYWKHGAARRRRRAPASDGFVRCARPPHMWQRPSSRFSADTARRSPASRALPMGGGSQADLWTGPFEYGMHGAGHSCAVYADTRCQ